MVKRYLQKLQQINMVIRTKKHIQVIIQVIIQKIRENKINRRTSTLKIIRINSKSLRRWWKILTVWWENLENLAVFLMKWSIRSKFENNNSIKERSPTRVVNKNIKIILKRNYISRIIIKNRKKLGKIYKIKRSNWKILGKSLSTLLLIMDS